MFFCPVSVIPSHIYLSFPFQATYNYWSTRRVDYIMKKPKKGVIILSAIALIVAASLIFYLTETDRLRLSRAYEYNNPLLCNLIWNRDTRLRCFGVLTGDFKTCETISDDVSAGYCFYGAAITTNSSSKTETLFSEIMNRCLKKGFNETICKTGGTFFKDLVLVNQAYKLGDPKSCLVANDSSLGPACFEVLSGNDSICEASSGEDSYKRCEMMFYREASQCNGDDLCYSSVAYYTRDTAVCKIIKDSSRRQNCFISIRDEPAVLGTL